MKELIYISELILPSKSAYSIQVMKMCDAFSARGFNVKLFVLNVIKSKNIHSDYNCLKRFNIKSFNINKNTFLNRIIYILKIYIYLRKKKTDTIIYSRSILAGLILSIFYSQVVIEIHHLFKGFTNLMYSLFKFFKLTKKIKFVFITKNLNKEFRIRKDFIVLDDAVDFKNFKKFSKSKKYYNTCVYTGSFSKGKGLETIIKISQSLPKINFHIYGDFTNSSVTRDQLKNYKNIFYKGYVKYKKIPKILSMYKVYLMPYSKKVYVRAKNLEVGNYMSPLKLFEYLASSGVLFASDMKVYRHILKKDNSVLIKNNSIKLWKINLTNFFLNPYKFKKISKNATYIAQNNTWLKRVEKIKEFINVNK